ncbi:MAG TPA: 50S ribosomal protein L18Ae [Candidatus Methanomethylicus sp.]|jgi:ribosomal protein L20A (L18A)|nr:50S ribosomal protein L18Ae [Candidatus Methanomethylicus sp.]HRR54122.1 50S ribosomal protein L18Ae [Candidatus Methanomethylicus sp.]
MSNSYVVKGKFKLKYEWKQFTKTVQAKDEASAASVAKSILGGNHGVKRFEIKVDSVELAPVKAQ